MNNYKHLHSGGPGSKPRPPDYTPPSKRSSKLRLKNYEYRNQDEHATFANEMLGNSTKSRKNRSSGNYTVSVTVKKNQSEAPATPAAYDFEQKVEELQSSSRIPKGRNSLLLSQLKEKYGNSTKQPSRIVQPRVRQIRQQESSSGRQRTSSEGDASVDSLKGEVSFPKPVLDHSNLNTPRSGAAPPFNLEDTKSPIPDLLEIEKLAKKTEPVVKKKKDEPEVATPERGVTRPKAAPPKSTKVKRSRCLKGFVMEVTAICCFLLFTSIAYRYTGLFIAEKAAVDSAKPDLDDTHWAQTTSHSDSDWDDVTYSTASDETTEENEKNDSSVEVLDSAEVLDVGIATPSQETQQATTTGQRTRSEPTLSNNKPIQQEGALTPERSQSDSLDVPVVSIPMTYPVKSGSFYAVEKEQELASSAIESSQPSMPVQKEESGPKPTSPSYLANSEGLGQPVVPLSHSQVVNSVLPGEQQIEASSKPVISQTGGQKHSDSSLKAAPVIRVPTPEQVHVAHASVLEMPETIQPDQTREDDSVNTNRGSLHQGKQTTEEQPSSNNGSMLVKQNVSTTVLPDIHTAASPATLIRAEQCASPKKSLVNLANPKTRHTTSVGTRRSLLSYAILLLAFVSSLYVTMLLIQRRNVRQQEQDTYFEQEILQAINEETEEFVGDVITEDQGIDAQDDTNETQALEESQGAGTIASTTMRRLRTFSKQFSPSTLAKEAGLFSCVEVTRVPGTPTVRLQSVRRSRRLSKKFAGDKAAAYPAEYVIDKEHLVID